MPIQNCPIDIPDGWEFVRYGVPSGDDVFLNEDGKPDSCPAGCVAPWVIIRPARPALEVGDWVKLTKKGFAFSGEVGRIDSVTEDGKARVVFDRNSDGLYSLKFLIKQTRIIDPYTLDQCIAAAVRLGRKVACEIKTPITAFDGRGVFVQDYGFFKYDTAAQKLTWAGGEAFGTERWEDAK